MKKLLTLILALVMCVSVFAGCSSDKKSTGSSTDKLVMGTNAEFPPFEYLEKGEMVGAEIDLAYALADKLDMELEIVNLDFDAVLPGVATGKFSIGLSGITATEERKQNMNFSDPYFKASQAIIVKADSDIKIAADIKDKAISCQEGTTGEMFLLDGGYNVKSFKTGSEAITALVSGKVDAVVIDDAVAKALSAEQNGKTVVLEEALTEELYAIAIKLGNDELTEKINAALSELKADGTLKDIFEKYDLPYEF